MYAVFLFPSEAGSKARAVAEDDLISRQSVTTRDAEALGTGLEGLLLLVEGEERALRRLEELVPPEARRLTGEDAEEAVRLLREEEEAAATGVGFLFGSG